MPWLLALFLLLLCVSAFFSGSEVALFSLRRWRVERYRQEARGAAAVVADLLRDPPRLLVTILIGNETVNILIANVGSALRRRLESGAPEDLAYLTRPLAAIVTTLVLVLCGELLPKNIAIASPERWAQAVAHPLYMFRSLARWPAAVLAAFAGSVAGKGHEAALEEEDFLHLLSEGERAGVLNARERELIHSVFEFRDATVRSLMTPRADIESLPASASLEEATAFVARHKFSRVPVYESSPDDIVGVLYVNDLVAHRYGLRPVAGLRALVRPPLLVPESKRARDLLREFQERSVQLAVVVDEYGATAGIVTMDDLLSEVVGEIADSFDTRVAYFTELQPGIYRVLARMPLPDFASRVRARLQGEGDVETVGGYVLKLLGRLPARGDAARAGDLSFTVLGVAGRQLVTLLVRDLRKEGPHAGRPGA